MTVIKRGRGRPPRPLVDADGLRLCNACGERFPLSEFHFRRGKPAARCKCCVNITERRRKEAGKAWRINSLISSWPPAHAR